jgi:hypothetical protein
MKLFKTLLVASLVTILGSCGSTRSTSCVQPGKCSKTKTYRVKSHSSNKSYNPGGMYAIRSKGRSSFNKRRY